MLQSSRLTKVQKLNQSKEFDLVFANPDYRFSSDHLLVLTRSNLLSFDRLGLVIGKKNVPKAVERNRIKRIIRETFRLRIQTLGTDVVVLARKGIGNLENRVLIQHLNKVWWELAEKKSP